MLIHFLYLLVIFAVVYFGLCLPLFQAVSRRIRGRKFVIRLGTPWQFGDKEQRWDVLMSALSFALALGLALFILDAVFPLASVSNEVT
jgi:hypothetical protein